MERYVDLEHEQLDAQLFRTIPVELMFRYGFVPLREEGDMLAIAAGAQFSVTQLDELELKLKRRILVYRGDDEKITELLKKGESSQRALEEATSDLRIQVVKEREDGEDVLSLDAVTKEKSPIVKLIDTMIFNAIQKRASDIHVETGESAVTIKYRIDGVLYEAMDRIDVKHHSAIISRIKVMTELDIAEKRVPQDGRFKVRLKGRDVDFRVSIMPTINGEDAVIRILDKESTDEKFRDLSLSILGFSEENERKLRKFIREPYGMILVTGPTGSGKTTTLYACISEIRTSEDKIITIEDPVEYQLAGVTQIPVNEKKGLTFARGLRSILRHDPDKIMVGEIRDAETATIAIQSALTGHLVFTTVHANNVVDVIGRFVHMGVDTYSFVSALNCILAQRLVRKLCSHCKRPMEVEDRVLVESGLDPDRFRDVTFYDAPGCLECNGTGYAGRTVISEMLDLSDEIREMILDRRPAREIRNRARQAGMESLRESAVRKVMAGVTSLREINKVTFIE